MPEYPYVINLAKPFAHYRYRMHQEDLAKQFGRFYKEEHGNGRTVCLLGMRADESLQRYSGFVNKKYGYQNECWISKQFKDVWCASPLYDWSNSDVWCANYRFDYDYNHLYDLYYKAGLKIDQMRVASPFNDYSNDAWRYLWQDKSDGLPQYYVTRGAYLEIIHSIFAGYVTCPTAE